jgi:hypothetical protein
MSQSIQDAYQNRFTTRPQIPRRSATSTLVENGWREIMAAKLNYGSEAGFAACQGSDYCSARIHGLRIATYKPIAVGSATGTATQKEKI